VPNVGAIWNPAFCERKSKPIDLFSLSRFCDVLLISHQKQNTTIATNTTCMVIRRMRASFHNRDKSEKFITVMPFYQIFLIGIYNLQGISGTHPIRMDATNVFIPSG
jgi:hypothetical protein